MSNKGHVSLEHASPTGLQASTIHIDSSQSKIQRPYQFNLPVPHNSRIVCIVMPTTPFSAAFISCIFTFAASVPGSSFFSTYAEVNEKVNAKSRDPSDVSAIELVTKFPLSARKVTCVETRR